MRRVLLKTSILLLVSMLSLAQKIAPELSQNFKTPPHEVRPQAWWWWLQTPTSKEAITLDLEEMKAKGLSGCMVLDGGVGPFGPRKWKNKTIIDSTEIRYELTDEYKGARLSQPEEKMEMWSKPWRDMVRFASKEAGRLGLDFGVFIGPAGCAAPWVTPDHGQQELVWGEIVVEGGQQIAQALERPSTPVQTKRQREDQRVKDAQNAYYTDVAVLAIPAKGSLQLNEVLDISDKLDEKGHLKWEAPQGQWRIIRFGYRPTGRNLNGVFYIDHLSKEVFDLHWKNTAGLLLSEMSDEERVAFKYVECDSWEAGDPNWTKHFAQEFKERRGYDIIKHLPALIVVNIDSEERTKHFINDFQLTISDLISENHYGRQQEVAHEHGLHSYAEAAGPHQYQADLKKCVGRCDVAMGEFWMPSPHREQPSGRFLVREAATSAHTYGIKQVFAESFTSVGPNWEVSPFMMKAAADQAFCDGLNWICFHTFTHRPSVTEVPGMTHSAGTHFDRTNTWWNQSAPFVNYLSRCSYMLQQGLFTADVLFYNGHGLRSGGDAFEWADGMKNPSADLGTGYDYDKCNEEVLLTRVGVKNGKLVMPDGMNYMVLVIENKTPVSLKALQKIAALVEQGATVVGKIETPMLSKTDDAVEYQKLIDRIWGNPEIGVNSIGKGQVIWNRSIREVLQENNILPDFECKGLSDVGVVDFIHRQTEDADIYYVTSRWQPVEKVKCTFRVSGKQPELWNPVTGETRILSNFKVVNGRTIIPMEFGPCASYFVVFKDVISVQNLASNWPTYKTVQQIEGDWDVRFDEKWGGPETVVFDKLSDWSKHNDKGIKYYSGKATYLKTFDFKASKKHNELYLDLGKVHELAQVKLNGVDLGVLWSKPFRINITSHLKAKGNKLEIDVVNLWPNRLIGDEFLLEKERYTQTNIRKFTKATQLLPSGLIGPVQIIREKNY
ncbi:glycosyl hydrolase [Saccharicrinis aurantiacus]|uniref:glycosyl hydrolase n=1 Tax=Saccharicrinis aurantiacus TaxID=1849719 RepID=UPI0024933E4F|nr:glycosyl hydrolase [Saccharicrinis aurantiacus]